MPRFGGASFMTTALAIITAALQELGVADVGQTPANEDMSLCLSALNVLADAWLTEPNYLYATTLVTAALPAATESRTIGVGGQFNTARPIRLEQGSYIQYGGLDYELEIITEAEYNALPLKAISAFPRKVYYSPSSPLGTVYFFPLGACTVKLNVLTQLSQFADLTTAYTLPQGYERAFKFTLLEEVAGSFSRPITALQARNAKQARRAIKRANFVVPQLTTGPGSPIGIPPIY